MRRWNSRKDGKRVYQSIEQCMGLDPPVRPVNLAALAALPGASVKR